MSVSTERTDRKYNYSKETHRLASFHNWHQDGSTSGNVCPLILARLGFVYTGREDTVVCCHCQTEVRGWSTRDDVRTKHSSCLHHFDCSGEMPFVVNAVRLRLPTSDRQAGRSSTTSNGDVRDSAASSTLNDRTATIVKSNSAFYEVCDEVLCRASAKNFSDIYNNTVICGDVSVPADVIIDRTRPNFERLRVESARFATFHDWPERAASIVDPRDLARAGMFYTGQIDRVQCAFCRGYLRNWVQGDKPAEEHHKHFPDCPFVRNVDVGTLDVVDNMDLPNQVLLSSLGLPSLDTVNIFSRLYCAQV